MDNATNNFELLYEKAKKYTETSIEIYKLNAVDKTADIISSLVSRLALGLVVAMFTLFVNIGISLFIGDVIGNTYWGFFIVSFFYLVLAIIIYFLSDNVIKKPITNLVIEKLLTSKKTGFSILDQFKDEANEKL